MPELPEVEIVKKSLERNIRSKLIKRILVKNRNLRYKLSKKFEKLLTGKKILKVRRFSKYLIVHLNDQSFLIIHLGMSGTIHLEKKNIKNNTTNTSFYHNPVLPKKHNHIFIYFDDVKFIYNDPRRFGYLKIIKNKKKLKQHFNHFGPEPFSKNFNINYLKKYLNKKEKCIKNFLLDQQFVSGIGNIYSSEILFECKINPETKAKYLKFSDLSNIIKYSILILNKAIKDGGSSIRNFKNAKGKKGSFQKNFKVYGRDNKNCLKNDCNGIIMKKNIGNRSSFFCNFCQK